MSKLLLYCTKNKWRLFFDKVKQVFTLGKVKSNNDLNGKIVAECDFEVDKLTNCGTSFMIMKYDDLQESYRYTNKIARGSCLDYTDLRRYLGTKDGYAIHIKNLHIFDKPKELYDCLIHPKIESKYYGCEHLSKAPQNMMYVELDDIKYILISIQPQWMCLILNRIKDVEVRKVVLKEVIK